MKLLAKRDFLNNCGLQISDAVSPKFVHAGAQFEIGPGKTYEQLANNEKDLVGKLNMADCVCEPTPANIEKVKAFVEERERSRA